MALSNASELARDTRNLDLLFLGTGSATSSEGRAHSAPATATTIVSHIDDSSTAARTPNVLVART